MFFAVSISNGMGSVRWRYHVAIRAIERFKIQDDRLVLIAIIKRNGCSCKCCKVVVILILLSPVSQGDRSGPD